MNEDEKKQTSTNELTSEVEKEKKASVYTRGRKQPGLEERGRNNKEVNDERGRKEEGDDRKQTLTNDDEKKHSRRRKRTKRRRYRRTRTRRRRREMGNSSSRTSRFVVFAGKKGHRDKERERERG
jgi:hypothetical protein